MRFDLTGAEWRVIASRLPAHGLGEARVDDRRVLGAIFDIPAHGRALAGRYGPYTTAYNRFKRWSRKGVWARCSMP